jgi:hypothetical protein
MYRAVAAISATLLLCDQVHSASISINIDSQSKLITASGSVSGTTDTAGGLAWGDFGTGSDGLFFDLSSLLNASGDAAPFSITTVGWGYFGWTFYYDGGTVNADVTISATGNAVDYSAWGAANIAALESTIGSSSGGLQFGVTADSFQISAVPEPGSPIVLGALAGLGVVMRRRR